MTGGDIGDAAGSGGQGAKPGGLIAKRLTVAAIALCLIAMPQLKYLSLHASFYDLGQYATTIDAIAFGGEWGQALQGHAHLLTMPYAWAYRLLPSPATLLALQSLVLIMTAALAGRVFARTGAGAPIDGALLFCLSISVWFSALFEFHFEHLLFPLFFLAFLASLDESLRGRLVALLCGLLICLVKETYALMAAGFGVYLIAARRWYLTGALLALAGLGYFLAITGTVIAFHTRGLGSGEIWGSAFGHLGGGGGVGAMLAYVLTHPVEMAATMLQPRKLMYLAALGGAFALLWLRRPLVLLAAAPVLGLSLISANPNHSYLGAQYSVGVVAPLFCATALSLAGLAPIWRGRLLNLAFAASAVVLALFGPAPISRLFLQDTTFAYGASAYRPTERDRWIAQTIERTIPPDPALAISVQNNVVTDRVTRRRALMAFPAGAFEPFRLAEPHRESLVSALWRPFWETGSAKVGALQADWIVLDLRRPLDLADRGCDFRSGQCRDVDATARFRAELARLPALYDTVVDQDDLMILRRR